MKRTIRDYTQIPYSDISDVRLVDVIDILGGVLRVVPVEYQDSAMLDSVMDCDGFSPYMQIYWDRPETEAETSLREAEMSRTGKLREFVERAQLEKLLNKYGVPRDAWVRKG